MQITLLYFARLREVFQTTSETLELPAGVHSVAGLITLLAERGGVWSEELSGGRVFRVAINQELVNLDCPLQAGVEVAIFPPVTGG